MVKSQHLNAVKVPIEAPECLALGFVTITTNDDFGPDLVRVFIIPEPDFIPPSVYLFEVFLHLANHHGESRSSIVALVAIVEPEESPPFHRCFDLYKFNVAITGASKHEILLRTAHEIAVREELAVLTTEHPGVFGKEPLKILFAVGGLDQLIKTSMGLPIAGQVEGRRSFREELRIASRLLH